MTTKEAKIFTWRHAVKASRRFKKLVNLQHFCAEEINGFIHPADCDDSDEFLVVLTPNDSLYVTGNCQSHFHTTNREDLTTTINERIRHGDDTMSVYDRNLHPVSIWVSDLMLTVEGEEI